MMHSNDFLGLVLCGGRSTRMGKDKGLMLSGKRTWVAQQYHKLHALGMSVAVSVNESQLSAYQKVISYDQLVQDQPFHDLNGPLRGLLSAHLAFPDKHILCIPCDMPGLSQHFLSELMQAFEAKYPVHQLFIPIIGWQMQPLCGIYSKGCLKHLSKQYEAGALANASMYKIVEDYPDTLTLLYEDDGEFENYNAPEDLTRK